MGLSADIKYDHHPFTQKLEHHGFVNKALVVCGRPPESKGDFNGEALDRVQSCVRPVDSTHLAAGPDEVRGPAP